MHSRWCVLVLPLLTLILHFTAGTLVLPNGKQPNKHARQNQHIQLNKTSHVLNQKRHGVQQQPNPKGHAPLTNTSQCSRLTIPVCQHLNLYQKTRLPNSFGHNTQHEVGRALRKYAPLMKKPECGAPLSLLLCLSYVPPCDSKIKNATLLGPPCRQLCSSAWSGCGHLMEKAKIAWPLGIDCERLPADDHTGEECTLHRGPPNKVARKLKSPAKPAPPAAPASPSGLKPKTVSKKTKPPTKPASTVPVGRHGNKTKNTTKEARQNLPHEKTQKHKPKPKQALKPKQRTVTKSSGHKPAPAHQGSKKNTATSAIKRRRYDITDDGDQNLFHGWVDVQGQGAANDYCRVVGEGSKQRFLSCALAGSKEENHVYVSKRGFDVGHRRSWFMRDMDRDGRDDYCRCVGRGIASKIACMKAGEHGFVGSLLQPGNQYTFYIKGPCLGRTVNPVLGVGTSR